MVSHEQQAAKPAAQPGAIVSSRAALGARRGPATSSLAERRRAGGMAELSVHAAEGGDDVTGRWDEETDEDGHRSPTFTSPPPLLIE